MEEKLREAKLTRYTVIEDGKSIVYGFDPEEAEEKPGAGYYFTCSICKDGEEMMRGISEPLTGPELLVLLDKHVGAGISKDALNTLDSHRTNIAAGLPI